MVVKMILSNFFPREMRAIDYLGQTISIPIDHQWVATDTFGCVCSFYREPEFKQGTWVNSIFGYDPFYIFLAGITSRINEDVARSSVRYYSNS